jgi:hypothetical protein
VVDTIDAARRFAPQGFRVASHEEIQRAGLTYWIVTEHSEGTLCAFEAKDGFKR